MPGIVFLTFLAVSAAGKAMFTEALNNTDLMGTPRLSL